MDYGKTILSYPIDKRKKIRKSLEDLKEMTKRQRELSYNLFINPLDERIKIIEAFQKNTISNNEFKVRIAGINKRIKEVNELMEAKKWVLNLKKIILDL